MQPLDLSVNKPIKNQMKWHSKKVADELESGSVLVKLRQMSVVKPLSANWFIGAFDYIKNSPDIIINGFKAAGILDILNMN